jgi:membrane-associated phospholipid phosphatase
MNNSGLLSAGEVRSLNVVYQWGLEFVRALQTIENPVLTAIIRGITVLGSELFYAPVILLIYWCINEKKGQRLALLLLLSAWVSNAVKVLLKQPRPYFLDPSVGLGVASGYGLPSGHAQHSLVFWAAALSGVLTERRRWLFAGVVTVVIGFTRLYLGVHFPTDLLAGWLLALLVLGAAHFARPFLERLFAAGGLRSRMIAAAAVSFGMNALHPGDRRFGALFLGFSIGCFLTETYFPFSASASVPGKFPEKFSPRGAGFILRGARFLLGIAGGVLIYSGLNVVLGEDSALLRGVTFLGAGHYELGRFLHYGILSLWASAGAPWLFLRLGLAVPPPKP